MNSSISQMYEDKSYSKIVGFALEFLIRNSPTSFSKDEIYKILISSYKSGNEHLFQKLIGELDKEILNKDYLINELTAEYYLKNNILDKSFNYFNKAISIRPNLKSARQKRLVLSQRLGKSLDVTELIFCINQAYKIKNINWLRINSYIAYSTMNFKLANHCLRSIITLGGRLNYIDSLTYTLLGDKDINNNSPSLINKVNFPLFSSHFEKENNKKLVITLATVDNYAFKSYHFRSDRLYIKDETDSYYIFSSESIVDYIVKVINENNYKDISIVGTSKAGTGALMIYDLLSKKINIKIRCVAFSPQVKLFPFNPNLVIPSYQRLSPVLEIHPIANYIINGLSQPSDIVVKKGDEVTIIYGSNYLMDLNESKLIEQSSGIKKIELSYSGHATSIPLTIPDGKSKEELRVKYQKLKEAADNDFMSLGGGSTVDLIDEIWDIYKNPLLKLNNFI